MFQCPGVRFAGLRVWRQKVRVRSKHFLLVLLLLLAQIPGVASAASDSPAWTVPARLTSDDGYATLEWTASGDVSGGFYKITETFEEDTSIHFVESTSLRIWRLRSGEYQFLLQACTKDEVIGSPKIELIKPDWNAPPNVRAFSTTRHHGFSKGPWSSLNLGGSCGDNPEHVKENRELLQQMLPGKPPWLKQVHGNHVVGWNEATQSTCEADAVFTSGTGQVCAVLTADCLPVLFCDKAGTKVAAAHAGWRGLAAGVLEATVAAMDCDPAELMAWMGPAIGPQAFEIGRDVYDAFVGLDADNSAAFKVSADRWLADLYALARMALGRVGVEWVSGGQYCTYSEPEKFFSYRRDRETGRLAAVIWLAA